MKDNKGGQLYPTTLSNQGLFLRTGNVEVVASTIQLVGAAKFLVKFKTPAVSLAVADNPALEGQVGALTGRLTDFAATYSRPIITTVASASLCSFYFPLLWRGACHLRPKPAHTNPFLLRRAVPDGAQNRHPRVTRAATEAGRCVRGNRD
jgi:hypothetical protein